MSEAIYIIIGSIFMEDQLTYICQLYIHKSSLTAFILLISLWLPG